MDHNPFIKRIDNPIENYFFAIKKTVIGLAHKRNCRRSNAIRFSHASHSLMKKKPNK